MRRKRGKNSDCCLSDRVRGCFGRRGCAAKNIHSPLRNCRGRVRVCKVNGDRKVCAKMASMGLYPGVEADIICAENNSQCLVKVNGGTISLDPATSENILVTNL
ncbi:MAG: ferrous iron transport protein A [Deltaproteobacteria bacterium]|nr:ferrous iron transport protein A [Deltaproteobacteria bacterium]MBW2658142.1 ferrous iron transport protein A [Deltaproteobacteria bacterium]